MHLFEIIFTNRPAGLRQLLEFLARRQPTARLTWAKWSVEPIRGGWNSRLYRATSPDCDLAIKFTPKVERDRVGREYQALDVLYRLGLAIAPRPLVLDREHYDLPVVVQEWLDDPVRPEPPGTIRGWQLLSSHLALVHAVEPAVTDLALLPAVFNFNQAETGRQEVARSWSKLPASGRSPALQRLVERYLAREYPSWPVPQLALCRCDNNILNFVRRPGGWASIDWENSGWGDPAFDVADLITHPAYLPVAAGEWPTFIRLYLKRREEPSDAPRIAAYVEMMLVWWTVRFARAIDELARGIQQPRLVPRPGDWATKVHDNYQHYLARAGEALAHDFGAVLRHQPI
jgi:aminoglycoside phosphotransferase (APT) family kinase protein